VAGRFWDEVYMKSLATEFERPVTRGKDLGFCAWLSPGGAARIEVGTE
jgi:hypothetical protein